jgi:hypothetical protein
MKTQRIFCFLTAFVLSGLGFVSPQKIYISPTGIDSNTGTPDKPLATLNAAAGKARELRKNNKSLGQVEIIALKGEYFMIQPLVLTAEDSGNENGFLVFKSEPGEKAVFRGGIPVSGFEKVSEKLWKAFVPQVAWYDSYFEQLYVNGQRAVRARNPNTGFYMVKNVTETVGKGAGRSLKLLFRRSN